jgi:hypothetical protein
MSRVRELPGVASVATASRGLLRESGFKSSVAPAGHRLTSADQFSTSVNNVSSDYFDAVGMKIRLGRGFRAQDESPSKPAKAVVNEAFVRRFFPGTDPIGRRFGRGVDVAGEDFEIVGVVADAKYRSLREPIVPTFFTLHESDGFVLFVRAYQAPESLISPVHRILAELDAGLPIVEVRTLSEEVDASAAPERITAILASGFAALAALLVAVGLYGAFEYVVTQERRAIGIRLALGATSSDITHMLAWKAIPIIAAGLTIGIGGMWLLRPMLEPWVYGISPIDFPSLFNAATMTAFVAVLGVAIPAWRARLIAPAEAIRDEN